MAQETTTRRRRTPAAQAEEERTPTRRTVLKRERVLVLPEDTEAAEAVVALIVAAKAGKTPAAETVAKAKKAVIPPVAEAWIVVGEFEGSSKQNAIEAYAGKPNTPEAKPGAYKAPGATAWAGGRHYERPPAPKVEARDLD